MPDKPLTATEIERRNKEYWNNPPKEVRTSIGKIARLQEKMIQPLIDRVIGIIECQI